MKDVCKFSKVCAISNNCPSSGCGLKGFLTKIEDEKKKLPKEQHLIDDLEKKYLTAWNVNSKSRARGVSTGKALEDWVIENLELEGFHIEKGAQDFKFGKFQVDVVIPSKQKPKVFLEVKINSDRQHALMFSGLINQRINKDIKIGYVSFYKPNKEISKILDEWKRQHPTIFNYFPIEQSWSKSLQALYNFIRCACVKPPE